MSSDIEADLPRLLRFLRERMAREKASDHRPRHNFTTDGRTPSPASVLLNAVAERTGIIRKAGRNCWIDMREARNKTTTWDWKGR